MFGLVVGVVATLVVSSIIKDGKKKTKKWKKRAKAYEEYRKNNIKM